MKKRRIIVFVLLVQLSAFEAADKDNNEGLEEFRSKKNKTTANYKESNEFRRHQYHLTNEASLQPIDTVISLTDSQNHSYKVKKLKLKQVSPSVALNSSENYHQRVAEEHANENTIKQSIKGESPNNNNSRNPKFLELDENKRANTVDQSREALAKGPHSENARAQLANSDFIVPRSDKVPRLNDPSSNTNSRSNNLRSANVRNLNDPPTSPPIANDREGVNPFSAYVRGADYPFNTNVREGSDPSTGLPAPYEDRSPARNIALPNEAFIEVVKVSTRRYRNMNLTTYTPSTINRRNTTPRVENKNRKSYSLPVDAAFPFTESSDAHHFRPISAEIPSYFDFGRKIKSRDNVDSTDQISTHFRRRGFQRPIGVAVTPKLESTVESIISRKRICNRLRRPFKGALPASCGNSEVEIPSEINTTSSLPPPSTLATISQVRNSFEPSTEVQEMTESLSLDNNNNNNSAAVEIINVAPNIFGNFPEQRKSTNDPRIIYHRNAPAGGKFRKMSSNLAELLNSKSSKSPEILTYTTTEGTFRTEQEKSVTSVSESEISSTVELTTYANFISSRLAKSSSISFDYDSTSTIAMPTIQPVESFDHSTPNLSDSNNNTEIETSTVTPDGSLKNGFKSHLDGQNFESSFHIITYTLTALGIIPLVVGMVLIAKMLLHRNKKEIFEGSEYSSEYNRSPLDMNGGGITSSPIATTKLPRISRLMFQNHWEKEKKCYTVLSLQNNNNWEIPRSKLRLQTILGQGNFGQVWKAEAEDIAGHEGVTRLVAVKMVKEGSSYRERDDLVKEMAIMQHLGNHPNVVTMLACCTDKEPFMLVMEYVMYGKLLTLLRDRRTRSHYSNFSNSGDILTSRDLTTFAYGIARGMEFITSKQVIHKDLAARNILLDRNKICKIADFGMSRYVGEAGSIQEHKQNKGALPIRWMAPESLHCNTYSYKTDVWSFGVLMWEIVTLGSMPYASMGARIVMRKVKDGYRLEKPKHCHATLFAIISQCWHADPNKRPNFSQLKQLINQLLEDDEYGGCMVDLDAMVNEMADAIS